MPAHFGLSFGPAQAAATSGGTPPTPPAPVADFTGTPVSGDAPLAVAFTYTGTLPVGTALHWEKDGGSGWVDFAGTPTARNPVELFAEGTSDVRATATNTTGSNIKTRLGYVVASAPPAGYDPSLDFSDARNSMYAGSLV